MAIFHNIVPYHTSLVSIQDHDKIAITLTNQSRLYNYYFYYLVLVFVGKHEIQLILCNHVSQYQFQSFWTRQCWITLVLIRLKLSCLVLHVEPMGFHYYYFFNLLTTSCGRALEVKNLNKQIQHNFRDDPSNLVPQTKFMMNHIQINNKIFNRPNDYRNKFRQ